MRRILFTTLLMLGFVHAQVNYSEWTEFVEGDHSNTNINNLITDGEFLYLNGTYMGDGCSFGGVTFPSYGGVDTFISKMDNEGEVIWTATIGGNDIDAFFDMKLDSENNVILIGWTSSSGEIVINDDYVIPGDGPEWTNRGIVAKFSGENGDLIWEKNWFAAEYYYANPGKLAVDADDNLYVGGYYSGSFEIDTIEFTYDFEYGDNMFLLKINSEGELIWTKQFEGYQSGTWVYLNSMDIGSAGLYFVFDYFQPYHLNETPLPYEGEFYWIGIANVDLETGNVINHESYGTATSGQSGTALKVDNDGNVLVGGHFSSESNLSIQGIDLLGNGSEDGYVVKFTPDLEVVWAKAMGGEYLDRVFNLYVNENNDVFVGGGFDSFTDFNYDGLSIIDSQSPNSLSMFELYLNPDGEFQEVLAFHGYDEQTLLSNISTVVMEDGSTYTGGRLKGQAYFEEDGDLVDTFEHTLGFVMRWDAAYSTLNTNEVLLSNFSVYPNPFQNNLHIVSDELNLHVNIYDLTGRLVYNGATVKNGILELSHLKNGVYILKLNGAKQSKTMKIIKK